MLTQKQTTNLFLHIQLINAECAIFGHIEHKVRKEAQAYTILTKLNRLKHETQMAINEVKSKIDGGFVQASKPALDIGALNLMADEIEGDMSRSTHPLVTIIEKAALDRLASDIQSANETPASGLDGLEDGIITIE